MNLLAFIGCCRTYEFDYLPTPSNAAMLVTVKKSALNFYLETRKQLLLDEIYQFRFDMDLSFKVSTMHFQFNNFYIPVADIEEFYFEL